MSNLTDDTKLLSEESEEDSFEELLESTIEVDELSSLILGLETGAEAEIKTTTFDDKYFYAQGIKLGLLSSIKLSWVRAPLTTGGYDAYMTTIWEQWSYGVKMHNPYAKLRIQSLDESLGLIDEWNDFRFYFGCNENGTVFTRRRSFNPDFWPIVKRARMIWPTTVWDGC